MIKFTPNLCSYLLITTTIDKDSIVRTPRMEVVWEPRIIIDKRGLFSLLFISDVDLADGIGQLTVICRRPQYGQSKPK